MSEDSKNSDSDNKPERRGEKPEDFPLQEYRLVPVEEWKEDSSKENAVDLIKLARHIWGQRWFITKVTGAFIVIGLLIALLSPVEYQVEATLLPEAQSTQGAAGGLLKQYGGLLGIGGNVNLGQEGAIAPQLYPQIIQSLPFQLELLNQDITFSEVDTTTTLYIFFDKVYTPSVFTYLLDYTIGLPGKVKSLFENSKPNMPLPKGFEADSIISVTERQMKIIEDMQKRISVSLNEESGVLTLTVIMPEPEAAAEVGKYSISLLKEYVKNYRTQKALVDLDFAQTQMDKAKLRFEETQNKLAEFRDNNVNLVTSKAQTQEQRLQSEYDLAFNVYNTLAQQVEQAKLKVQEQTPVVSILQPVQLPIEKSSPQRKVIMLIFVFVGICTSVGFLILNQTLSFNIYE